MILIVLIYWALLITLGGLALFEARKTTGKLYWHIHHDKLLEMAAEPIARRKKYIVASKAVDEIKTRLRYLRPVKGTLPGEVIEAFRFHGDVMQHRDKMWKLHWSDNIAWDPRLTRKIFEQLRGIRDQADADLRVTLQKHESEINRLHSKECSCPWDGTTLFPRD